MSIYSRFRETIVRSPLVDIQTAPKRYLLRSKSVFCYCVCAKTCAKNVTKIGKGSRFWTRKRYSANEALLAGKRRLLGPRKLRGPARRAAVYYSGGAMR